MYVFIQCLQNWWIWHVITFKVEAIWIHFPFDYTVSCGEAKICSLPYNLSMIVWGIYRFQPFPKVIVWIEIFHLHIVSIFKDIYIYTYIYIYIYIYICPCVCMNIYINTYLCMYLHMFFCVFACVCIYIYTYIYVCFSFVHVCINECVCIYIYIYIYIYMHVCTCIWVYFYVSASSRSSIS